MIVSMYSEVMLQQLMHHQTLYTTIARNHPTPTIDTNCICWVILVKCTSRSQEDELVSSENSASIFNTLSDLPSQLRDGPAVLGEAMRLAGTLSQETLEAHRHKHLAYILNEQTQLNNGNNTTLNTNLNKVSLCKLNVLKYQLFLSETKRPMSSLSFSCAN